VETERQSGGRFKEITKVQLVLENQAQERNFAMKTLYLRIAFSLFTFTFALSQHQLPFESKDNRIELSVHNTSAVVASGVKVEVSNVPGWLHFTSTIKSITQLKGKGDTTAAFSFSVDKLAPIKKPQTLTFTITSSSGEMWTKQLDVSVNPPDHFELYQNYPNPFNPSTTISYLLPNDARVVLKIYNSIGQEVTMLVNDERSAGYHQEVWNASNIASGMYIYQIAMNDQNGKKGFYRKKMLMLK
jgi:Secretion system C-terminal sorting domain